MPERMAYLVHQTVSEQPTEDVELAVIEQPVQIPTEPDDAQRVIAAAAATSGEVRRVDHEPFVTASAGDHAPRRLRTLRRAGRSERPAAAGEFRAGAER